MSFGNIVLDQTKQDLQKQYPPINPYQRSESISPSVSRVLAGDQPCTDWLQFHVLDQQTVIIKWFHDGIPLQQENQLSGSKSSTPSATPLSSPTRFQHVGPVVRPVRFWDIFCSLVVCSFFLLHALIHLLPIYDSQFEAQKVTIIIHKFLSSLNVFLGHCWCHLAIKMPKDD